MAYIPVIENARIAANAVTTDKVLNATLTDSDVAAANKDGAVGVASMRTIGSGALQAMAGSTTLDAISAPTSSVSLNSQTITNLADPTSAQDAATKAYVDAVASGLDPKASVLYTTTGNIVLSGTAVVANGTWPGALTAGDRVLVKNQTDPIENGIYDAAAGAWARSADFDGNPSAEVTNGAFTLVSADDGSAQVGTGWVVTSADPIVVDTDAIVFTQITSPGSVSVLNDLTDVNTAGVVTNSVLVKSAGDWLDSVNVLIDDANRRVTLGSAGASKIEETGSGHVQINTAAGKNLELRGGVEVNASLFRTINSVSHKLIGYNTTDTLSSLDNYVVSNTTAGAVVLTLPASPSAGQVIKIKRTAGANALTIAGNGGQLIDGAATLSVALLEAYELIFTGTDWVVY